MIAECPGCKSRHDVSGRPAGTRARCRCGTVFALPDPTETAGALACPNCRAPVGTSAHHCPFCRAELLVRACPRCFARIFHGHAHCPHCGVAVAVPAHAGPDGSTRARRCPACPAPPGELLARLVGDVLLDECPTCLGIWLDAAAVDRVVRERRESSIAPLRQMNPPAAASAPGDAPAGSAAPAPAAGSAAAGSAAAGSAASAPATRHMYIHCPDCDQLMNRVNFARRSGIILDVCRAHGTWFDASELSRVVDFVLQGGVEESQRREIEELREQARRAAAGVEAERLRAAWSTWPADRGDSIDLFGSVLRFIGRLLS